MTDFIGLNWDLYPNYDEITINPEISTSIFSFESDVSESVYEKVLSFLKNNDCQFKEESIDGEIRIAKILNQNDIEIGIIEPFLSWLIIVIDNKTSQLLHNFIYESYEKEIRSCGAIEHTECIKIIKEKNYVIKIRTGTNKSSDVITPYSFFELYHNNRLLAKAILEYYNGEMGVFEPTILLIEVQENNRQKGIGRYFLRFIECYLAKCGFISIWSSDTKTIEFWEKMGYDIDIDEGLKILDPFDCDDEM